MSGTADFYRSVSDAINIGQPGTAEDLGDAISALQQMAGRADITEDQRAYLGRVIASHDEARTTLVEASENAIDAWVTKVLGNIGVFGGPEALAQAKAIQDDGSLTSEQRQKALSDLEVETWETKTVANIQAFGGDEALVRVQTLLGDGSLTPEQRQKALSDLETRVIDQAEDKYDQEMQEARDLALSLGWDPDARGGRPELTPSEFIQQYNYDVAVSLGWDPERGR